MNSASNPRIERRKYPRAKFQDSVIVHNVMESKSGNLFEVQGSPIVVKAQDVSEGGIRLEIGDVNPPNKIFKLKFEIQKDKSVDIYSKLAWFNNGLLGLQFIVADSEIRKLIRMFVEKSK